MAYCSKHNRDFWIEDGCPECNGISNSSTAKTFLLLSTVSLLVLISSSSALASSNTRICADHPVCKPLSF